MSLANKNPKSMANLTGVNKNPQQKQHNLAINKRRQQITMAILRKISASDVKDVMDELLYLVKSRGRGQLKALEMFFKLVSILPKQEIETYSNPTYTLVPKSIDPAKLATEDEASNG